MAQPRFVLTLVNALLVLATIDTMSTANSSPSNNNSGIRPASESKCHNIRYNYNNFYSGANKKIETLLHEVKTGLNEMKESKEVCQGTYSQMDQTRIFLI